jgi:segregation and condensation protein A
VEQPFESALEAYPVHLENFEGPLDLLLHLIKKHEVNIYDIPIALITKQYLVYLELMQELNLDVAGEFLVMAATLIHIKSRMLLPRPAPEQEDPEEDPRELLVRRLIEHQKFKAAAEMLHEKETVRSAQWTRPDGAVAPAAANDAEPELEVDLFSLITAFRAVVQRSKQRPQVVLPTEQVSIEGRIDQLFERLSETEACGFEDLFEDINSRGDMIVTFLALLEMIRLKLVRVFQSGAFGEIRVYRRARPADAPRPIGDVSTHAHPAPRAPEPVQAMLREEPIFASEPTLPDEPAAVVAAEPEAVTESAVAMEPEPVEAHASASEHEHTTATRDDG